MTGVREDWFPTSIWYFDLPESDRLNKKLLQAVRDEQKKDSKGIIRSAVLGWHSHDSLNGQENFREFMDLVGEKVIEVARFYRWDLEKFQLVALNCWAIVNGKLAYNVVHNHPNSLLSGVYYVQVPENSGNLFFCDPRSAATMMPPPIVEYTPWTFQKITYQPKEGRMLIFPSWLMHGVEPNMSEEERICLSFNINVFPNK